MTEQNSYDNITNQLKTAYDDMAANRNDEGVSSWKIEERKRFLAEIRLAGSKSLLEIGAGHGRDGLFFQNNDLSVVCVDISSNMVALCQKKGLEAYQCDVLNMPFSNNSFDSIFALNSFLHIPRSAIHDAMQKIKDLLNPKGLFYLGVYGGKNFEGIWQDDRYTPKRFFCYYSDEDLLDLVSKYFNLIYFHSISVNDRSGLHFQSLILRNP